MSCLLLSRVNDDLHGKYLHFTRENTRVPKHGVSRVCEVTVELYRIYTEAVFRYDRTSTCYQLHMSCRILA